MTDDWKSKLVDVATRALVDHGGRTVRAEEYRRCGTRVVDAILPLIREQLAVENPDYLDWRLAQRRKQDHPRYDPFYDASDEELASMVAEGMRQDVVAEEADHHVD